MSNKKRQKPGKKQKHMDKFITGAKTHRRFHGSLIVAVLAGLVGSYFLFNANAATSNPPLTRACGLDVALLLDTSVSMTTGNKYSRAASGIELFLSTLRGTQTQFAIGRIDQPSLDKAGTSPFRFTGNLDEAERQIPSKSPHGQSEIYDLTRVTAVDPRSDRPNLIIVLSDFIIYYDQANADAVKQGGTRILAIIYDGQDEDAEDKRAADAAARAVAGPKFNTGSIFTSDVIYANPSTIEAQFQEFARQLCFSGAVPNPDPGGDGPGTGGDGTGTDGQGQGQGPGPGAGGGGGSAANQQDDKPNPLPSKSSQGDKNKQPEVEPSPFFDGKLFAIGSDADTSDVQGVSIAGRTFGYGWLYVLGGITLIGVAGTGVYWWLQKHSRRTNKVTRR